MRRILKVLLVFFLILTSILFLEFFQRARWYFKTKNIYYLKYGFSSYIIKDDKIGYRLRPGIFRNAKINSKGFRDREFTFIKHPNIFRIVCLGDSTTFGYYNAEDRTYPFLLEKLLNKYSLKKNKFEVINLGIPAYTSFNNLKLFEYETVGLKPDLVILAEGWNDYMRAVYMREKWSPGLDMLNPADYTPLPLKIKCFLREKSLLFLTIDEHFKWLRYTKPELVYPQFMQKSRKALKNELAFKYLEENVKKIILKAKEKDIKLIVLEPFFLLSGETNLHKKELIKVIPYVSEQKYLIFAHKRILKILVKLCRKHNIPLIKTNQEFCRYPKYEMFKSIMHLTDQGNRVLARKLFFVIENLQSHTI